MARTAGVTEAQVHAAADSLVAAGEKPTIERLRAHLGTGSPNTLLRALETWWSTLGQRLIAQRDSLAMPGAPQDVVVAANRLWEGALAHARNWADGQLASEQEAVQAAKVELAHAQSAVANERVELERVLREAQAKQMDLSERLVEAKQESSVRQAEIQDLKTERHVLIDDSRAAETRAEVMQHRLDEQDAIWKSKLEELRTQGLRSEQHWMGEVDRLRQEIKALQKEFAADRRLAQDAARRAQTELQEANRAKTDFERQLAASRAEAAALDRQWQRLAKSPAAASLSRGSKAKTPTAGAQPLKGGNRARPKARLG